MISDEDWYPDIGATYHFTNDFNNFNLTSEEYTGNGSGLSIYNSYGFSYNFKFTSSFYSQPITCS